MLLFSEREANAEEVCTVNLISLMVFWIVAIIAMFFSPEKAVSSLPAAFISSVWIVFLERRGAAEIMVYGPPFIFGFLLMSFTVYAAAIAAAVAPLIFFLKTNFLSKRVLSCEYLPPAFVLLLFSLPENLSHSLAFSLSLAGAFVLSVLLETTGLFVDERILSPYLKRFLSGIRKGKGKEKDSRESRISEKLPETGNSVRSNGNFPKGLVPETGMDGQARLPEDFVDEETRRRLRKAVEKGEISVDELSVLWVVPEGSGTGNPGSVQYGNGPAAVSEGKETTSRTEGTKPEEPGAEESGSEKVTSPMRRDGEETLSDDEEKNAEFDNEYVSRIHEGYVAGKIDDERFGIYRRTVFCLLNLLDTVADVPSVTSSDEEEGGLPKTSYDILKRVSLAEHVLNVVARAEELTREEFGETYLIIWPSVLAVCIAHDLGKAPTLRSRFSYYYGSHARVSAEILSRCTEGLPAEQRQNLYDVVLHHHGDSKKLSGQSKRLLELLKKADSLARKEEWNALTKDMPAVSDIAPGEFFRELFSALEEEIARGRVRRFPFVVNEREGILYVSPALVLSTLRRIVEERRIYMPDIFASEESVVAQAVSGFLIEVLPEFLPAGFLDEMRRSGRFFLFKHVLLDGSPQGRKTFVPFLLVSSAGAAGKAPEDFVSRVRDSAFWRVEVGT